ncbi:hypothetical protein Tco_0067038 [Tanacetum coccineum]
MDILSLCTVHWKYTSHATFMSRGNLLSTRHVSVTNAGISALCLRTYIAYTMHGDTGLQTPPMRQFGRKSNVIFALPNHGSTSSVGRNSNAIFALPGHKVRPPSAKTFILSYGALYGSSPLRKPIAALPGHRSTSSVGRKSNVIFGRKLKIDMAAYGWKVRTSPRRTIQGSERRRTAPEESSGPARSNYASTTKRLSVRIKDDDNDAKTKDNGDAKIEDDEDDDARI